MRTGWVRGSWSFIAIGVIGLWGAAPWAEAKSSSQTIGVAIIVPERPSLPAGVSSAASRPQDLPAQLDGSSMERTTTLIRNGNAVTLLYTAVPTL